MVLTVSQRNNRDCETLLRPAARRIVRRAAFHRFSEMSYARSLLSSDGGGKFFGVELLLSLPERERHSGQPASERQARHLRTHALVNSRLIPTLARLSPRGSHRRIFEDLLEFRHRHRIESPCPNHFLPFADRPIDDLMIGARARDDRQPAIRPKLMLGAKAMRRANKSQQHRRAQGADSRQAAQDQILRLSFAVRKKLLLRPPAQLLKFL